MTQKELIIEYIKENGSILPAKMSGEVYKGTMFGSETSKRCRELRKLGKIESKQDGKFERFYIYAYRLVSEPREEVIMKYPEVGMSTMNMVRRAWKEEFVNDKLVSINGVRVPIFAPKKEKKESMVEQKDRGLGI
jgi:hypothetical protein